MDSEATASVVSVSSDAAHDFSKPRRSRIRLVAGLGVEGDAHFGEKVQHLSRMRRAPDTPNLRQVHLIHSELFDQVSRDGFVVQPGEMGENVTTAGVDLLSLPRGTRLLIGPDAAIELTGLRNPSLQINAFQPGLMKQMVRVDENGQVTRRAGVMAVVLTSGEVAPGDGIRVELPTGERAPLEVV